MNEDQHKAQTIVRLRTGHHKRMKIVRSGRKMYRNCNNCPDTEVTTTNIFYGLAILAAVQKKHFLNDLNFYGNQTVQMCPWQRLANFFARIVIEISSDYCKFSMYIYLNNMYQMSMSNKTNISIYLLLIFFNKLF